MAKIYTKKGDEGLTSLYTGERVSKCCDRVECYGSIDELQAVLGLARSFITDDAMSAIIRDIQEDLMRVMADLASTDEKLRISEQDVSKLEGYIDAYTARLPKAFSWQTPGSASASAALHVARTVSRRCERALYRCVKTEEVDASPELRAYLNRLSDVCYALAAYIDTAENGD